ncbi:Fe-S cluster assembly ATPase SufC [Peptostreptococcus porci]|uniref:Fe-S cluster assembly ATPase SufC n=1 Tax=Peptostreptococcus porci TaxID=2652282 RepID=A0A6N7XFW9_9FIRM|nr:Fe-S cluster assembly ATPase SufC [Peptostreptococcus porci]MDD7183764.1 Fe-S cluster assembly ATPase SufC [Peptostreptococcus porci]MDY2793777.1 Fe-S cluster assembly ATPase SufC [Peptostreptococcus porci]MDY4128939.1 Fe-S cluster assembly ATPase SufC [Peptostreptococcus porci]MDY4560690.1 Fe-S cluster assembly ATPase SufC [Peptostreptococcus porci]MDY5436581.1 Fe-S cluster assembly ATPase SufC [Peptostreptococcus porci]
MSEILLEIKDLCVRVGEKDILKNVNLKVNKGETHVIMGPNGSGKSTLVNTIMSNPKYEITSGKIFFEGEDVTEFAADERAKRGIFMSFQSPIEVPGISVENFIRTSKSAVDDKPVSVLRFNLDLSKRMKELEMKPEYASRYMNYGFSGGEKKKTEILQMQILNPKLAMLDETDSGLDVDAVRIVSEGIKNFKKDEDKALMIITHHKEIISNVVPDYVHVIIDGKIVKEGDASLIHKIEEEGYGWIRDEVNSSNGN